MSDRREERKWIWRQTEEGNLPEQLEHISFAGRNLKCAMWSLSKLRHLQSAIMPVMEWGLGRFGAWWGVLHAL